MSWLCPKVRQGLLAVVLKARARCSFHPPQQGFAFLDANFTAKRFVWICERFLMASEYLERHCTVQLIIVEANLFMLVAVTNDGDQARGRNPGCVFRCIHNDVLNTKKGTLVVTSPVACYIRFLAQTHFIGCNFYVTRV